MKIKIDLCCGKYKPESYIGVDIFKQPEVDIVFDLTKVPWPFEDSSVDEVRAHDAIEHLPDKIQTMNEIWRICKSGALVDIFVPSTDGRGAFQDPTHVSYWNLNSFSYYSSAHPSLWGLCKTYGFKGNFKIKSIGEQSMEPKIMFVRAYLEVVK
jgi:predicted SAM-dependent methyltransferase